MHEIFNYTVDSLFSEQAPPVPQQAGTSGGSSPASTSSTASAASAVNLSATARSILETLEKMSTPLKDAHKMPVPRAEKRKAIAEELLQGKFRNNSDDLFRLKLLFLFQESIPRQSCDGDQGSADL